jgi:hypothetical protein
MWEKRIREEEEEEAIGLPRRAHVLSIFPSSGFW